MLKSKNYLFKVLVVIAIIVSTIFVFSGCGKKNNNQSNSNDEQAYMQPLNDYFGGIKNKDLSMVLKAFPDFMQMSEKMTETDIDDLYKQYETIYGANVKIDYSLGDAVALGEDEIKDLEDNLLSIYPDQENVDITAAYTVPVTVTFKGDGVVSNSNEENNNDANNTENNTEKNNTSDTNQEDMYVIQYNGNWYIM